MTVPSVTFTKLKNNAGTVKPSSTALAIIAPAAGGTANQPSTYTRPSDVQATFLEGPLVEIGAYFMSDASLPVLPIKPTTSTASTASSITTTKTGTFTPTVATSNAYGYSDDYNVLVNTLEAGVLGSAGIVLEVSLDGGLSWSAPIALGTALTLSPTVPVTGATTGMSITLGTSTETMVLGDQFTFTTVGPRMTSSDLLTALAALALSKQPWDLLIIHGETSATLLADVDTWLTALELKGQFKTGLVNTRFKATLETETEATFATAMATLAATFTPSIRVCCGTDGAAMVSPISGVTKPAPTSMYIATRAEQYSAGVDPAEVDLGEIPNANLNNAQNSPLYHDEMLFPTLDGLGLSAMRSFYDRTGAYINDALMVASVNASDYFYLMNARTMNLACGSVFTTLTNLLSQGIRVDPKTGFILELQAAKWESLCQKAAARAVAGQVSGVSVTISRDDVITGNGPQTITVTVQVLGFKYVKKFAVTSEFVNQLS